MVEYDKLGNSEGDRVCKILVDKKKQMLKNLWKAHKMSDAEASLGFGVIGDEVHTSAPQIGEKHSVKESIQLNAIEQALEHDRKQYDHIGSIHVHPVGDEYMSMVMSPGDFNSHVKMSYQVRNFTTSMVLTKDSGEFVLFGIETHDLPIPAGDLQREISEYYNQIEESMEEGEDVMGPVSEMTSRMLEFSEPCSVRFR